MFEPYLPRAAGRAPGSACTRLILLLLLLKMSMTVTLAADNGDAVAATPVSVAEVVQAPVVQWRAYSGRLAAIERVEIKARVAGTLLAAHFREGALVRRGALLFTLDPEPFEAEVRRLQAELGAATTRASQARTELSRAERLSRDRVLAQSVLDDARSVARAAEATVRAAEAALESARLQLSYTRIEAPISGRIGRVEITPGNQIGAGADAPRLTTLVSLDPIDVRLAADERGILAALGTLGADDEVSALPVRMRLDDHDGFQHGQVNFVDNQIDPLSGTLEVRARFANPAGRMRPGQFVNVELGDAHPRTALLVAERAILTDQDKRYVWVMGEDGQAQYREVALGVAQGGLREITTGLAAGERIVVNGLQRVRPGAVLEPQPVTMPGQPAEVVPGGASQ